MLSDGLLLRLKLLNSFIKLNYRIQWDANENDNGKVKFLGGCHGCPCASYVALKCFNPFLVFMYQNRLI